MWAMNFSAFGMISFETRHALHFGNDKTEVQLRRFRKRAFANLAPVRLNEVAVKFGDLADGDVKFCNLMRVGLARALKSLCKNGFRGFEFGSMIQ